jgi:hypothetical protein
MKEEDKIAIRNLALPVLIGIGLIYFVLKYTPKI